MSSSLPSRLEDLQHRMATAAERSGRTAEAVSLVAVTKTFGPERVAEVAAMGLSVMGENRIQEAKGKIPLCASGLEWHLIGHLQTNKVRDAVALFDRIHSVDSLRLLCALNDACGRAGKVMPVHLQVNVSGEAAKYGLAPESVPDVLEKGAGLMHVDVVGLMTIPPFDTDPESARPHFRQLCRWRDQWRQSTGFPLDELSMGMSNDFEVAIEEGATWVRLGSALLGQRGK